MLPALPTPSGAGSPPSASGGLFSPPSPGWRTAVATAAAALWNGLGQLRASLVRLFSGVGGGQCTRALQRLIALLLLVPLLAGCGGVSQPPRRALLDALALQISLTQEQVAQALGLPPVGLPEVSRVRVDEQEEIRIGEGRGLRLSGRFDWRLANDPIRVDSPFELYLQRGERGQSWRLARPVGAAAGGVQSWLTDPLTLPG